MLDRLQNSHDRKGDITSEEDIQRIFEATKPKVVYHVAAIIVTNRAPVPDEFVRTINVKGNRNVLEESKLRNIKALVFMSTASVTHKVNGTPMVEHDESFPTVMETDRADIYSKTKAESERLVLPANTDTGLKFCSLRTWNTADRQRHGIYRG
ncbi:hypothetical protein BX600DRAFT_503924 [Xylariales sp. PMI_506]|nr:hypothetical protein BX600DRAFT_503924 [Xylariales sp. PMI_506]